MRNLEKKDVSKSLGITFCFKADTPDEVVNSDEFI